MTHPLEHRTRVSAAHASKVAGYLMGAAVVASALSLLPALASGTIPFVGSSVVRTVGIALAVGLDVLALSTGIGVLGVAWAARLRVGAAFAFAEVLMQIVGALIGAGVGRVAGEIAAYAGFVVLALLGVYIFWESFGKDGGLSEKATTGWGLVAASASISLDSLGVGFSLPALDVSLVPLVATIAVTTVVFTFVGLRFGELLGRRFKHQAERGAGAVLMILAVLFTLQHFNH